MEEMGAAYMAEGLVTLGGSRMYTSMADTDEVVDDALARFARVFDNAEQHAKEQNTSLECTIKGINMRCFYASKRIKLYAFHLKNSFLHL